MSDPDLKRELRWRFPDPSEAEARAAVLARIDDWWRAFAETAPRLDAHFKRGEELDVPAFMWKHLHAVDERIMWEFGPGTRGDGGHRLVMTPETERHLRPLVDTILARAPTLPGWEFFPYRRAESLDYAIATVKGRTGLDVSAFSARATGSDDGGGLVDVTVYPGRSLFGPTKKDREAAFVALESLLGEETLDAWVGQIAVEKGKGASLAQLPAQFAALVEAARARLPAEPYLRRAAHAEWSLLKLEPGRADDHGGQDDMLIAKTMDLTLWKAARGALFDDRRFSRLGETFCYLKVDGTADLPEDGFTDKASIEDAVNATLGPPGLGVHIGGGTGLRYSYVDMAVTDVNAAVQLLRPVLRQGKLPLRSWILFFDARLANEWIPIWDETPPPPL